MAPWRSTDRPIPIALRHDQIHVWYVDLRLFAERCALSGQEQERARRFHSATDRDRYISAHCFWRRILGAYLNIPPGDIQFANAPLGKPYVITPASPLQFSGSHAGDFAGIAIAKGADIGLDLETSDRAVANVMDIAAIAFSAEECRRLRDIPEADQWVHVLKGWTQKEALAKGLGTGLHAQLAQLPVQPWAHSPFPSVPGWQVIPLRPGPQAFASLAAPANLEWDVSEQWLHSSPWAAHL